MNEVKNKSQWCVEDPHLLIISVTVLLEYIHVFTLFHITNFKNFDTDTLILFGTKNQLKSQLLYSLIEQSLNELVVWIFYKPLQFIFAFIHL